MTAFTKLPNTGGGRRSLAFGRQSEESDDEKLTPALFCSSCGSYTCMIGADWCARQRRLERLEAVSEYIFTNLKEKVEGTSPQLYDPALDRAESERWTVKTANERLHCFRRSACQQLADMSSNRGRRLGERKARVMQRGCFEEPGTGNYPWTDDDVTEYAVDQLRATGDWKGMRFSSNQEDDNEIAQHLATRPELPEPETMSKQISHCRAAGALSMALRAASATGDQAKLAAAMIPGLVEQYLKDCPVGDLAPVGRGGQELSLTKMMALVMVLMQFFIAKIAGNKDDAEVTGIPSNLQDPQVQEAMTEVMQEAVSQHWDNRTFALTSEEGAPGDDCVSLTVYGLCKVTGESWEEAVGELIASGVRKVKEATSNASKLSQPSRFSLKEFAKQKKHLQETGKPVRLSADDCLLYTSPSPRDQRGSRMAACA